MNFEHHVIDDSPPSGRLFVCEPTDITGNGVPDLIVGGAGSEALPVIGDRSIPLIGRLFRRLETDLFWYENPGPDAPNGTSEWERHSIFPKSGLHILGGTIGDVNGNGRADAIVGQAFGGSDIYWFEQPTDPTQQWTKRLIADDFSKYHDLAFGDVDNDGEPEVVGCSQESETIFYYDVPDDPTRSPWPDECLTVICEETSDEGLAVVDIDGDGNNELIAGTSIYRQISDGNQAQNGGRTGDGVAAGWSSESIVDGWDWTRVAVGDVDDDGELEVVFTEGDSPLLGTHMGRLGWFDPPDWEPHVLDDDLYCPHTVQLADFDGNGSLDIYVAEMGLGENDESAQHLLFRNEGGGEFRETVASVGVPTHEAKAVDVDGNGRPDIIGKSYEPNVHVDVWYNEP
ncbi:FG-GAP-like repeat-containing protein [Halorubrum sp. DTA46]|uniref:FG-GAP repeat domain-containing protein n=1 Tax=Halorubrum sp. DTA46 TaxID=3402162 RepID=UPI003AAE4A79